MKRRGIFIFLVIILIAAAGVSGVLWRYRVRTKGEMEFYEAKKLYEQGKYNESYLAFASLLNRYHRAIWIGEAIYYTAKNLSLLGRDTEARKYWEKLRDKYGEKFHGDEVNFYIGHGYEMEGDTEKAEGFYQKVIKEFSTSSLVDEALLGLGRIYEKEKRLENAVESFEKVATNFPGSEKVGEALLGIANLYEKKKDWEKSLSLYYKVKRDYPEGELAEKAEEGIGRINMYLIFSLYPTEDSFIYKVEEGDNLSAIAQKFNTTIDLIREVNSLNTTMLKPGQRLKILKSNFNILISKKKNKLYLENNGKLIKVYKVATGKDDATPEGEFTIVNKLKDPTWYTAGAIIPPGSPENILGSRWLGLSEKGYGLHATSKPDDIGKYVTNGCIRLMEEDVQELYKLVPIGTPVKITK